MNGAESAPRLLCRVPGTIRRADAAPQPSTGMRWNLHTE
jgi:hypothetical protein